MLARALAARGHEVTWFISNFEHRSKSYRDEIRSDTRLPLVEIRCLPSITYDQNISFARIRYERSFGRAFAKASRMEPTPNCIILAEPALFYGREVRKFSRDHRVPLIVDVLDLWPEMFRTALPRALRPLGRLLFAPLHARRRKLLHEAAGVATCTAEYSRIMRGLTSAPVETFYLGVDIAAVRSDSEQKTKAMERLIGRFDGLTCVYAGTLGEAYDMQCIADAVERLSDAGNVRLIVAGTGPQEPLLRRLAERFPKTMVFLGELAPEDLPSLYAQAQVGLCTYAAGSTVSMPVKLFDYLAAGLAVVTSLGGEIAELLHAGAGARYAPSDPQSLAAVLIQLAADSGRLHVMRTISHRLADRFDQTHQHANFAQYVEKIVGRA
jgi:glycosyltransferase involved in cell wall biosynthesis